MLWVSSQKGAGAGSGKVPGALCRTPHFQQHSAARCCWGCQLLFGEFLGIFGARLVYSTGGFEAFFDFTYREFV